MNLLDFTTEEFAKMLESVGESAIRASEITKLIHQLGNIDFINWHRFSKKFREFLSNNAIFIVPKIVRQLTGLDGTKKWLLELEDHEYIEMVYIPDGNRGTLCISTQVGCPMACQFCATGTIEYKRNLTLAEIIGQLWLAVRVLSPDRTAKLHTITNLVFMGMGEPLLNLSNVLRAIKLMLDDCAYGIARNRVTVSSCGLIPELQKLREQSDVALAISLHAPNDKLRNRLMPVNRCYPLAELLAVTDHYFTDSRRKVTIEYIMLRGINDTLTHANELAALLTNGNYKINLIPGNVVDGKKFLPSTNEAIDAFRRVLLNAGYTTITRKTRGAEIAAACGQLVAENGHAEQ